MASVLDWMVNPVRTFNNEATGGANDRATMGIAGLVLPGVASLLNAGMQREQNERQERMTWDMFQQSRADQNTAVQRRAADMKAAGINPLMAAGEGAGTTSGTMGVMPAPRIEGPPIMEALNLKLAEKKMELDYDIAKKNAETARMSAEAQTDKAEVEAWLARNGFPSVIAEGIGGWRFLRDWLTGARQRNDKLPLPKKK